MQTSCCLYAHIKGRMKGKNYYIFFKYLTLEHFIFAKTPIHIPFTSFLSMCLQHIQDTLRDLIISQGAERIIKLIRLASLASYIFIDQSINQFYLFLYVSFCEKRIENADKNYLEIMLSFSLSAFIPTGEKLEVNKIYSKLLS